MLYGCWPLKGAFSQPSEAKARTTAKASYCCLYCRSTANSSENILPEFSKFYCHPGKAGGSPFWIRALEQVLLAEETTIASSELQAKHLLVGHSTYLPARALALLHDLNLITALGIRMEHKPGLTLSLVESVAKGTLHAGVGFLPITHPELLVYLEFYNSIRPHSSLKALTPNQVYFNRLPELMAA